MRNEMLREKPHDGQELASTAHDPDVGVLVAVAARKAHHLHHKPKIVCKRYCVSHPQPKIAYVDGRLSLFSENPQPRKLDKS